MTRYTQPLTLTRGRPLPHRMVLAPLTNSQSQADGTLTDTEIRWLVMRAQGGCAMVMTAAAHVQRTGQGFPGQLGIWSDAHLPGLTRLASEIRAAGSLAAVQLHHAGMRSPADLIGEAPKGPFADADTGTVALTTAEVGQLRDDFIAAAVRAEAAGFDGVELHGAHGYVLGAFLDGEHNRRGDGYGGSLAERSRILHEVIDGIRAATGPDFQLGLRLSPERFGIVLAEAKTLAEELMTGGKLDYLEMSLWDCFKQPEEPEHADTPLIAHFTGLARGNTRLGVAGKIMDAARVQACLDAGADFVSLGRAAILHHDFAARALADPAFAATALPVTRAHLAAEGVGETFIGYLAGWPGFVAD